MAGPFSSRSGGRRVNALCIVLTCRSRSCYVLWTRRRPISVRRPRPLPQEERAARHLRMLARAAEIHMEIMRGDPQEAVEAPQPGVDYGQRIAVVAASLRLTLLLEDKFAVRRRAAQGRGAARAAQEDWHDLRVRLAMLAAAYEVSEDDEEADRRADEVLRAAGAAGGGGADRSQPGRGRGGGPVPALGLPGARWSAGSRWPTRPWSIWASYRRRTARRRPEDPPEPRPPPPAASPGRRTRDEPPATHPLHQPPAPTNAAFHTPLAGGVGGVCARPRVASFTQGQSRLCALCQMRTISTLSAMR